MLIQMKVRGLMYDPINNAYIVILRDENDREILPIWIGKMEAGAISLALEGVFSPRPMTHDLIKNLLDVLGASMISVVLTEMKDNTYYSKIHLMYHDAEITVDARPSDAIALSLRANVPIFVAEGVVQRQSSEELDRWLDNLSPEDFGKYEA